jgi:hypothetical protein
MRARKENLTEIPILDMCSEIKCVVPKTCFLVQSPGCWIHLLNFQSSLPTLITVEKASFSYVKNEANTGTVTTIRLTPYNISINEYLKIKNNAGPKNIQHTFDSL